MTTTTKPTCFIICGGGGWLAQTQRLIKNIETNVDLYYGVIEDGAVGAYPQNKRYIIPRSTSNSKFTMLKQMIKAFFVWVKILRQHHPEAVIAIATPDAIPLMFAAKCCGVKKRVFVESLTRVNDLSSTGRMMHSLRLTTKFYVQWPNYLNNYKNIIYKGMI